jgi:tetratricopeptide (TPR) repeat protein
MRIRSRPVHVLAASLLAFGLELVSGARLAANAANPPALVAPLEAALRAGIDANFAGDFDAAARHFEAARRFAPEHPAPEFFAVTTLFWRIELDSTDTRHDEAIRAGIERAVALAERRLETDTDDVEALAWGGQALGYASRREAQRGRYYAAGSTGERARKWLDRSLALAPTYGEAKPALGAYLYFSDLAPRALKWLSFLWFVPKGDAQRGLALLEEAAAGDGLGQLGSRYALAKILMRFEPARRDEAVRLIQGLRERFPSNAILHLELIRALAESGDLERATREADELRARAAANAPTYDARTPVAATLWLARAALLAGKADAAETQLASLDGAALGRLAWAPAWHGLMVGQLHDGRGERDAAVDAYQRVIDLDGAARDALTQTLARNYLEAPWQLPGGSAAVATSAPEPAR